MIGENILRAVEALTGLGYRPRAPVDPASLADAEIRRQWIRDKNLMVFSMWSPAHLDLEVDLFVEEPFDFEQVYSRALRVPLERIEITVVTLDDLIALKKTSGRPLDRQDAAALESLRTDVQPGPQEGDDDQP
jgi:hypothetical protein